MTVALDLIPLIFTNASVALLIVASIAPYLYFRVARNGRTGILPGGALSASNCFAAGVFLGTCFLGLIPHTLVSEREVHARLRLPADSLGRQLLNSNLLILLGILLIIVLEQSVTCCIPAPEAGEFTNSSNCCSNRSRNKKRRRRVGARKRDTASGALVLQHHDSKETSFANAHHKEASEPLVAQGEANSLGSETEDDGGGEGSSEEDEFEQIQFRSPEWDRENHMHSHHSLPDYRSSVTQSAMLLLAMSSHSIFEGVALAVQEELSDFLALLLSIMAHEVLCSFAYGVSLANQRAPLKFAMFSSLFLSLSIPAGMLLMLMMGSLEKTLSLAVRFVLESLSAGIFIHVACVEMLADEFHHQAHHQSQAHHPAASENYSLSKCISMAVGIFLAFLINLLTKH